MTVQVSNDLKSIRITEPMEMTLVEAAQLVRDLMQAVSDCGGAIQAKVKIPPPTNGQIMRSVHHVAKMRQAFGQMTPWNDVRANTDIVMRVIETCSERDVSMEQEES